MKILFLQKVDNARGGIATVNVKLMSYFLSLNHKVDVLSIRHGYTWESIPYPQDVEQYVINEKNIWGVTRGIEIIEQIKGGHFIQAVKLIVKRIAYKKEIAQDYKKCKNKINELAPDVIINSHYELLDAIDEKYLKKTLMHFHTSFDQVLTNRSYREIFSKYAKKIYRFVWLSERTKSDAVKFGLDNSEFIYNPLPFSVKEKEVEKKKKIVFLGRLMPEKRIHLAIDYFNSVVEKWNLHEWTFEIYGDGDLKESVLTKIQNMPNIHYMGLTDDVKKVLMESSILILTSEFEGMPLVVLEANECAVPAIVYDFGESSKEVIHHEKTGIIVPQNDSDGFKDSLAKLMIDEDFRSNLSREAKVFAEQFSVEKIGQKWMGLFSGMES